ncbi:hypothetical protein SAMN05421644_12248 [Allochromatium warmingii]|uniref:Uncharacterized protein n=1 Tax=Allochromatium warmingii TaxID=61595 RepID=A0A1H3G3Q4_ALLWA|nr:hypothetical protein SAMN05421644_12248 [Allochromatium warmingii]
MMKQFNVVIEKDSDSYFVASVPEREKNRGLTPILAYSRTCGFFNDLKRKCVF